jgi:hypothetical protein
MGIVDTYIIIIFDNLILNFLALGRYHPIFEEIR